MRSWVFMNRPQLTWISVKQTAKIFFGALYSKSKTARFLWTCNSIFEEKNFIIDQCALHNFCSGCNSKMWCLVPILDLTTNSWATAGFLKKTNLQKGHFKGRIDLCLWSQKSFVYKSWLLGGLIFANFAAVWPQITKK